MSWKKAPLVVLVLFMLGAWAYLQREELLPRLFNAWQGEEGLALEQLSGLDIDGQGARIGRLVLLHSSSGRRIVAEGISASYRPRELLAPRLRGLTIETLRVSAPSAEPRAAADTRLRDWVERLEELPLDEARIDDLILPPLPLPIAVHLRRNQGEWALEAHAGRWRARAGLARGAPGQPLLLRLRLENGQSLAELGLLAQARDESWQLRGQGFLDIPDLAKLPAPVSSSPVQAARLRWEVETLLPDRLASGPPRDVSLRLDEDSSFQLAPAKGQDKGARLTLAEPALFALNRGRSGALELLTDHALWRVSDAPLGARSADLLLALENARMSTAQGVEMSAVLTTRELDIEGLPSWLPGVGLTSELKYEGEKLRFEGQLRLAGAGDDLALAFSGSQDVKGGAGEAVLHLPRQSFSPADPLSARFGRWPFPFDLAGGVLEGDGALDWRLGSAATGATAWRLKLAGVLEELTGYHGEVFFQGLAGRLAATIDPAAAFPLATPTLELSLKRLNVGVDLTHVLARLRVDPDVPALEVDSLSAELLGGRLHSEGFKYRLGEDDQAMTLGFDDLRLERVLDLVDYEGVEARGGISGTLPLRLEDGRLVVEQGSFQAEEPGGTIRYLPRRREGGNVGLDLVEQALSDYRFESLGGDIEYHADGELLVSMRMQGHNPEMNGGQRIDLNLTLSDNVPVLLRSLQAGRSIQDMLENRL